VLAVTSIQTLDKHNTPRNDKTYGISSNSFHTDHRILRLR
jgi:hypothetical protein